MTGRRLRSMAVAIALAAGLAVVLVVPGRVTEAPQVSGEILLQLLSDPGPDPFTATVVRVASPPSPSPASSPGAATASPTSSSSPATSGAALVQGVSGSDPGLYGGTRRLSSCDATRLSSLLTADGSKASAWAQTEGVAAADIDIYIKTLTGVVLRQDTRVTAHGYSNGAATNYQAVLQAATAVLVDPFGAPRVRCASGNPLTAPVAQSVQPVYLGIRWPGFESNPPVAVSPASAAMQMLILVDPVAGVRFARPVGGDGTSDTDATAG